ncbi:MAG: hypothetical protein H6R22_1255, partial [Chromatiaceae bacterium]|nr:hypothetical protein [Chromatiaceae bacterium]
MKRASRQNALLVTAWLLVLLLPACGRETRLPA